ncbi:MAG TPA: hypothetical protein PLW93_01855 [Candidatus Absconditabacterales bacterium]|nr:hypothetical protein [Candidatus Absconditabacterales bacterium]HNG96994.1 hypothetical protein [Candidatus Absconditabacterales bacterium]
MSSTTITFTFVHTSIMGLEQVNNIQETKDNIQLGEGFRRELSELKGEITKEKHTPEQVLNRLQTVDLSLFDQPKVLLGGSLYNTIDSFKYKQGIKNIKQSVILDSINKDGTIKFSLTSWGKITKFDYDPQIGYFYLMPKGKPEHKIWCGSPQHVLTVVERINFCKYIHTSNKAISMAPYEKRGDEISKGDQYLVHIKEIFGSNYVDGSDIGWTKGEQGVYKLEKGEQDKKIDSIILYLNDRKQRLK